MSDQPLQLHRGTNAATTATTATTTTVTTYQQGAVCVILCLEHGAVRQQLLRQRKVVVHVGAQDGVDEQLSRSKELLASEATEQVGAALRQDRKGQRAVVVLLDCWAAKQQQTTKATQSTYLVRKLTTPCVA